MDNKVYYGEYSLRHWIDLILKQNICLPKYQRYFVWDLKKTKELVKSFNEKQFIPPVTIGAFFENDKPKNYILDGQQRLTSILLVYLGLFPDKNKFITYKGKGFIDEDDNPIDEGQIDNILEWNFDKLVQRGSNKETIKKSLHKGNYENIEFDISEDFFDNNFLGFSYLVPQTNNKNSQQKYYSTVFRNINIQGQALLPQESRESLYFLNEDLKEYFTPNFSKEIKVKDSIIDFVRYLSLLSQYKKSGNFDDLGRGYFKKMEIYYEEYIYSTVGEISSEIFCKFTDIFENGDYSIKLIELDRLIRELGFNQCKHESIIDVDIFLFGLCFFIIFDNKSINMTKCNELLNELKQAIKIAKKDDNHKRNPSAFKYLRGRIQTSITIYKRYINE